MKLSSSISVLLADDDKDDCLFFQDILTEIPLSTTFHAVYDGEYLIRYLADKGNDLPDVIFLDLNMPRKNGYTCLDELKSNENFNQIPVIIFSTSFDDETAHQLYNKGAHYYICKPSDYDQLRRIIESALQLISSGKTTQPPKEKFLLGGLRMILL